MTRIAFQPSPQTLAFLDQHQWATIEIGEWAVVTITGSASTVHYARRLVLSTGAAAGPTGLAQTRSSMGLSTGQAMDRIVGRSESFFT